MPNPLTLHRTFPPALRRLAVAALVSSTIAGCSPGDSSSATAGSAAAEDAGSVAVQTATASTAADGSADVGTKSVATPDNGFIVRPILFVPRGLTADPVWQTRIPETLGFIREWYAIRLDGRTFTLAPLVTVYGDQTEDWYRRCDAPGTATDCTKVQADQHYYQVLGELARRGFPVGDPQQVKTNLAVFMSPSRASPAWYFGGGAIDYKTNMSYVETPKLARLRDRSPYTLVSRSGCPFTQVDCDVFRDIVNVAHELTHSFGLNHVPAAQQGPMSIIEGGLNYFPNAGFAASGTASNYPGSEREFMLQSPFMNASLAPSAVSPVLRELGQVLIPLYPGMWTSLSLPVDIGWHMAGVSSPEKWTATLAALIAPHCDKVAFVPPGAPDNGTGATVTYDCAPGMTLPAIAQGTGIKILGKNRITLQAYGYRFATRTPVLLRKGQNLVGPQTFATSVPIETAFGSALSSVDVVYAYDPANPASPWKRYKPGMPAYANTLKTIDSGKAYEVKMLRDSVWN